MIRNEYAVALLWTGPSEVGQVKIVAHFCSFVLIPLLRPALCREGPPQTPCRHRPAYAVDPRRRKGRVSRGGGSVQCRAPSVVPAEAGTSQPSSLVIPAQAGIQVGEGAVMPSAAEASLGQLVGGAVAPAPLFPIPRAGVDRSPVVLRGPKCAIVSHSTPAARPVQGRPTDAVRGRCAVTDQRTRPCHDRERGGCQ